MFTLPVGGAGGVTTAAQRQFTQHLSKTGFPLEKRAQTKRKKIRGGYNSVPFGCISPAMVPSLDLVGLLECGLSIRIPSDSSKVTATYRSPSLSALASVQQVFGGIVHPHPKSHPYLRLNATSVYLLSETLAPLQTPWARRYTALLSLRAHKASYDSTAATRETAYRTSYAAKLAALITTFRETPLDVIPMDEHYTAGAQAAQVVNQDPTISATLTWKQDGATLLAGHRERKIATVQTRLATREQARQTRAAARRDEAAKRKAVRETQWEVARTQREAKRAAARIRQLTQRATRRTQVLEAIARGERECDHCHQTKPLEQFNRNKRALGGYQPYCKRCVYERDVVPNRSRLNRKNRAWIAANPEAFRESCRKQRRKPANRLRSQIRTRIKAAIDRPLGTNTHIAYLGCSIPDLRAYIETLWSPGMTWDNYGSGASQWCIDHIVPHVAFDHSQDQHLHWCWHYRNLRPLWARENAVKSDLIGGISVRQYQTSGRQADLHALVATELERLGITTKDAYLTTVPTPSETP